MCFERSNMMIWCISADSFIGNNWLYANTWQWRYWLSGLHTRGAQNSRKKVSSAHYVVYAVWFFYHVTACNATHSIAVAILSVSLFVRCVYCDKTIVVSQYLNTIQNEDISILSTMRVAGNCPLPPEIFTKSDWPPSKNTDFDRFSLITSQP